MRREKKGGERPSSAVIKVLGETKLPIEVRGGEVELACAVLLQGEDVV